MCYYNGQLVTRAEYIRLKQIEKLLSSYDFLKTPLQIGFDYGKNAILKRIEGAEDFDIVPMEWGFIPQYLKTREEVDKMRHGYKDASGRFHPPITTLNAKREELLLPGKIFRDAALKRRCLTLSSGFYEWRHVYPRNKKTGELLKTAIKYPHRIHLPGREYFFMASIWQPWTDRQTGEYVESFAIVTAAANKLMEQVHNSKKRMPCILPEDLAYEWLFGDLSEQRIREIATYQYPYKEMKAYPVRKDFQTYLDPTEPYIYEDLPELALS
jgi:putative SOS response-associated peptidase YedK